MNMKELTVMVATEYGMSNNMADSILHSIIDEVRNAVASGDSVRLAGLGSFRRVERSARTVATPAAGSIKVPAHGAVKFSAAKAFKELVK